MPSGLISTSWGSVSARRMSAASLGKGAAERPWKERVQSIFSSAGLSSSSGLSESPLLEIFSVVARLGVGDETRDAALGGDEGAVFGAAAAAGAGVGFVGVWLLLFWVVYVIVLLVEVESWVILRLGALEVYDACLACCKVSIAFQGRILRGADIFGDAE